MTDILTKSNCAEQPKSVLLDRRIQKAVEEARTICTQKGPSSKECAAAWDIVEELQAEASHQRGQKPAKTAFEQYCEENRDAAGARIYES